MSLLDDLKQVKPRKLSLAEWLISRTPEERSAFEKYLADTSVPIAALVAIVRNHGGSTSKESLTEMRYRVAPR